MFFVDIHCLSAAVGKPWFGHEVLGCYSLKLLRKLLDFEDSLSFGCWSKPSRRSTSASAFAVDRSFAGRLQRQQLGPGNAQGVCRVWCPRASEKQQVREAPGSAIEGFLERFLEGPGNFFILSKVLQTAANCCKPRFFLRFPKKDALYIH